MLFFFCSLQFYLLAQLAMYKNDRIISTVFDFFHRCLITSSSSVESVIISFYSCFYLLDGRGVTSFLMASATSASVFIIVIIFY